MRVTAFGGAGFIGSHLTERLLAAGHEVLVVDLSDEKLESVSSHPRLEFLEIDITDSQNNETAREIVGQADVVVDLIAYANPQQYIDRPIDVVELNLFENLKIVDYCIEHDVKVIQFSTCEVYGMVGERDDFVFHEDTSNLILGPVGHQRWIYSCAKQLLERMVHAHGENGVLEYTIVRPFNFIGPKMDYIIKSPDEGTPRVFAAFMSALLYDHPMYLVNGGYNRRTFTHIDDAIDAIMLLLENPDGQFTNEIVNIGSPANETSIRELAELMREIYRDRSPTGELPPLREVDGNDFYGEGYSDSERRVPDISKLTEAGWEPTHDLRETFELSMEYYIDRYERG